jgi:hypothetical protein
MIPIFKALRPLLFAGTMGLLAAAVPTSPAVAQLAGGGPQQVSLPGFDDVMGTLRAAALGAVKGCDYAKYMTLANDLYKNGLTAFESYDRLANNPKQRWAIPFMDPIADFLRAGEVTAAKQSAKAEAQGLAYTLEQVCHAVVQADDVNRMHNIIKSGRLNIGNAIRFVMDKTAFGVDYGAGGLRVTADYRALYSSLVPPTRTTADSLFVALDNVMHETLEASNAMAASLDQIEKDLEIARRSLLEYAYQEQSGTTAQWACPEPYKNFRPDQPTTWQWEQDPADNRRKPVCGPVQPERATQILASLEVRKVQLRAIQMSADTRALEVEAAKLMANNHTRKQDAYTHHQTIVSGW